MGSIKDIDNKTGSDKSAKRFPPCIATMSLGSPTHSLETKLQAAASKGFLGVELYWDDLLHYSLSFESQTSADKERLPVGNHVVLLAASEIAKLANSLRLRIVSLQPFRNFDGLINKHLRKQRLQEFHLWLSVARRLDTNIIGVPSTLPTVNVDDYTATAAAAASDLEELCGLAGSHGIRIAYENLCFAAHVRGWEEAWERIQLAGEPGNLLFLPDIFNICGQTFIDPEAVGGKTSRAAERLQFSLKRLVNAVPMSRIPVLQIADAELIESPLTEDHPWRKEGGLVPLMALSRNARLFPFEKGGYLPVLNIVQVLAEAGWEGWVSMEVFSRTTLVTGEGTIWEHANRAWAAWETMADFMGWIVRPLIGDM